MASYSQMSHPLAGRPAASQRKRRRPSLDPASAPIDGRVMADFLVFLEKYARQVNFWEVQQDEFTREGYLSAADWSVFFQKSLPFALARLAKTDITDLNLQVFNLLRICRDEPEAANFQILLDFIFEEILQPFVRLDQASRDGGLADFTLFLNGKLAAGLQQPVQFFQKTGLAGQLSVCINPPDFQPFLQNSAWGFANETALLLTADERTALPITNQNEFIRSQAASLEEPLRQMLVLFGEIAAEAPRHLDRALLPLEKAFQENHEPHLGLVFAFLELFKQVQGDLNKLTARHLEFFYEKVLRFVPREAVPDRAHLVFEISKHLDRHKVAAGTLVKDGKDDRKADILFALDEEIILDKTSIAEVRTLFLNKKMVGPRAFIESLHMAPNALKADGLEKDFPEGEPKNWATLGDRPSKWLKPASLPKEMVDYPVAPLGLALSSPVLLLQEGDRTVTVSLKLKNRGDLSLADFATKVVLPISSALLAAPLFLVDFSGKDGWLKPKADPTFTFSTTAASGIIPEKLKIDLIIKLAPDEKAVVFFDKEKLKADYRLQTPYPTLRLRFNPDLELEMPLQNLATDPCEQLKNPLPTGPHFASPYEWLKDTDLEDINISVVVNGVKNLLVSNDESTQNVNSQMLPFGARPTNGDHFYIGSKEVFCKNWSSVDVHTEWKDLPLIFDQHYAAYTGTLFGSNLIPIERADFQLKAEALDQANWQAVNLSNPFLFPLPTPDPVNDPLTTDVAASENQLWHIDRGALSYFPFSMPLEELPNRSVESQKGFVSLKLQGSDMDVFRHKLYPFLLANRLMQAAGIPDSFTFDAIEERFQTALNLANILDPQVAAFSSQATDIKNAADALANAVNLQFAAMPDADLSPPDFTDIAQATILNPFPTPIWRWDSGTGTGTGPTDTGLAGDVLELNLPGPVPSPIIPKTVVDNADDLRGLLQDDVDFMNSIGLDPIPKEPYTPTIKKISLDYEAKAEFNDIALVHLHPFEATFQTFEPGTSRPAELPPMPVFSELIPTRPVREGSIFLALADATPGGSLRLFFQLAEATADSERERADLEWHHLFENEWRELRPGFEIIDDATDGLTRSGIIRFSLPTDLSKAGNTILPDKFFWLRASVLSDKSKAGLPKAIAETISIHVQAVRATFKIEPENDLLRLDKPLAEKSLAKLAEPDSGVKKLTQPYPTFNGKQPENGSNLYLRASETLRHKGRALAAWDFEHLVLEAFPEVFKVKCLGHTFALSAHEFRRDVEAAPGFVTIACVPDLTKIQPGNSLQPRLPVSLLTEILEFLNQKATPFASLRVMNPRYEPVAVRAEIMLRRGFDPIFYQKQLIDDLTGFLAPWSLGDSEKLSFGQPVTRSAVLQFIERLGYVDFITLLELNGSASRETIFPISARSILTAGEITIDIADPACEQFDLQKHCGNRPFPVFTPPPNEPVESEPVLT